MTETGYGDFEFERKFFVRELPAELRSESGPELIVQSYFLAAEGYALRVRLSGPAPHPALPGEIHDGDAGVLRALDSLGDRFTFCALTAKGPYVGGTRYEAERELDIAVGLAMVRLGGRRLIKLRHSLWLGADGWVVDEFLGDNAGLVVAECEREGPVTDLVIPPFAVTEVTDDPRFANDRLVHHPYREWGAGFEAELAVAGPRFLEGFGRNEHTH
ncbi:hypothetical protein MF406_00700 [Georgenia sp. TF02-10]|uniref:hypothetical protein n=1 Tax=Georgenia sp. TF02-10 TaxID=2917725 RepID=UPI001FA6E1EE|nr:hypothetical protein [Georgenia sp. TF02-10]UNX54856.1 hypothetical protein MF406_00700 [Georgenia sp. TF02-10]